MLAAEKLRFELARYHGLRQHRDEAFRAHLHALQAFQVRRLHHTHAALICDPVFHDATNLFLNDIYGGIDLMPMAREIERALPRAIRLLPDSVLNTSAMAAEVMTLIQELDEQLAALLFETRGVPSITVDNYLAAFRDMGRMDDRLRQMTLAAELGHGLDKYVRSKIIFAAFRLANRPAHRYGFGILYDFLDRGFRVMRPMGSTHALFDRITQEERTLIIRIRDGEADPFRLGGQPL